MEILRMIALFIDVRETFLNPYGIKSLRGLRGDNDTVADLIEKTPRYEEKLTEIVHRVEGCDREVWIGCVGGHHRSVHVAGKVGRILGVPVCHRDYFKP